MIRYLNEKLGIEESANALTHGIGLVLSIAGFIALCILAFQRYTPERAISSLVYGTSLVALYAASTFYHSTVDSALKAKLRVADYCCIYLLIAGSYTPFTLSALKWPLGPLLLTVVWAVAILGILSRIFFGDRFHRLRVVSYVGLGWAGIVAIGPLYDALGWVPLALVIGGGVSYTVGILFFAWENLHHHHAVFHIFVLLGSILHFAAIAGFLF